MSVILLIFAVLLSVFLLPVLFITDSTYLNADDFCRAGVPLSEYFSNLKIWYFGISGRYFNYLITYIPVYNPKIYRVLLGGLFLGLGWSLDFLLKNSLRFFRVKIGLIKRLIISALIYIGLITQLPSLFEYFFWYAASSVYLLSTLLFCIILGLLFSLNDLSKSRYILLLVLIFCVNGNNEMFILLNSFILILLFLVKGYREKKIHSRLLWANIVCWISGAIVILSPASGLRQSYYPEAGDVWGSILNALLSAGMFFIKKLTSFPEVLFYSGLFLIFLYYSWGKARVKRAIHPLLALVFSIIAISVVMVVPYYATGGLSVNAGRIGNMVQVLFVIILSLNLLNAAVYIQNSLDRVKKPVLKIGIGICIGSFLILTVCMNPNYSMMYKDYANGSYATYKAEVNKRLVSFQNGGDGKLILHKIKSPLILKHWEVSLQPGHWSNTCYKDYLSQNYHFKIDSLIIKDK